MRRQRCISTSGEYIEEPAFWCLHVLFMGIRSRNAIVSLRFLFFSDCMDLGFFSKAESHWKLAESNPFWISQNMLTSEMNVRYFCSTFEWSRRLSNFLGASANSENLIGFSRIPTKCGLDFLSAMDFHIWSRRRLWIPRTTKFGRKSHIFLVSGTKDKLRSG